jgi:hypothetical protein
MTDVFLRSFKSLAAVPGGGSPRGVRRLLNKERILQLTPFAKTRSKAESATVTDRRYITEWISYLHSCFGYFRASSCLIFG